MKKSQIYFVSSNKKKYTELRVLLSEVDLLWYKMDLEELQTEDAAVLIRNKAQQAFRGLRRPLIVDHTELRIHAFRDLPSLGTSYFYNRIGACDIIEYCKTKQDFKAEVRTYLCFCDGKKYYVTEGGESGEIATDYEENEYAFAWDSIFIPDENNPGKLTYEKMVNPSGHSMRKKAVDALRNKYLLEWTKAKNPENEDTETKDIHKLTELIKQKKVMLFVGAGISRSVGLPDWGQLINRLGNQLGYDAGLFDIYGDNMMLAEYAGIELGEEFYQSLKTNLQINNEIRSKLNGSSIYESILKLDFPVIYTTNYDNLLEEYYKDNNHEYDVVNTIEDMRMLHSGSTRIMKFHGSLDDRTEIVLAESQYFKRMDFQSFMDVQLQADLLKYHVLFIGYSLSDINVKLLMYLARKRQNEANEQMQAYIFTVTPNQVQKAVFNRNNITPFFGTNADKETGTTDFLRRLCAECGK